MQLNKLVVLSLVLCLCGVTLLLTCPLIYRHFTTLHPSSPIFKTWKDFPNLSTADFYLFNWTNPLDIQNSSIKPKFEQRGPYRFWQSENKGNIKWNKNGTITYQQRKFWYYNEGDLDDVITTINPIILTAAYLSRYEDYVSQKSLAFSMAYLNSTIHVAKTAGEFLFDGYQEPMIDILANSIKHLTKYSFPIWDHFAWFYRRNGSHGFDGVFNMGTGVGSIFGHLYSWNYQKRSPYYTGDCAEISGFVQLFEPTFKEKIQLFVPELRRVITLKYSGQKTVNGILGNRYTIDEDSIDNGTIHQCHSCNCNGDCIPYGVLNISTSRFLAPVFVSLPHFHLADASYINSIEGMEPDKNKHEFSITIEPRTGIPLEAEIMAQLNLLLKPIKYIAIYETVPKVFIPAMWYHQSVKVPGDLVYSLRLLLHLPIVCNSAGILLILIGIGVFIGSRKCVKPIWRPKLYRYSHQEEENPLRRDSRI